MAYSTVVAAITLALPGPTNTLLALAGSVAGFSRALRFVLAAVLGYSIAVTALATALGPLIAAEPKLSNALRLVAAGVLAHAALCL
jgi:threonine/homoserine/homoserine lactone efflux protein